MEKFQYNRIQEVLDEKNKDVYWLLSQLEDQTIHCVVRWCKNVKQPTIEEMFEIAKVLEVDVRDLIVSIKLNPNQDSFNTPQKTSMRQLKINRPINNTNANNNSFDVNSSMKKHKLSMLLFNKDAEFNFFSFSDKSLQWGYKKNESFFNNNAAIVGLSAYLWIIEKLGKWEDVCWLLDLLNKRNMSIWEGLQRNPEELISEIKQNVPSFRLEGDPNKQKKELQFAWIDLQSFLMFVNYCTTIMGDVSGRDVRKLRGCSSFEDIATLICSDMGLIRTNGNQDSINSQDVELPF